MAKQVVGDLAAEIMPGQSLAGIQIDTELSIVIGDLREMNIAFEERKFSNVRRTFSVVSLQNGVVEALADETGLIRRLTCRPGYLGKCKGLYSPGMSVRLLRELSREQLLMDGQLMLDKDFGFCFDVPDYWNGIPCVDVKPARLPEAMVLHELHVMRPDWWQPTGFLAWSGEQ